MYTATWEDQRGSPIGKLFVIAFVCLLLIGLSLNVLVNSHAVLKHGDDALAIRACLKENGEYQIWKSLSDPNKFFRICELKPGLFGFQIVQCIASGTCEKTAFIKGDGSWRALVRYLGKIATRFNGAMP